MALTRSTRQRVGTEASVALPRRAFVGAAFSAAWRGLPARAVRGQRAFPWAWSGEGLPDTPGVPGQQRSFTGDPPHERQGWYSIYAHDQSTISLVTHWAARIEAAARACKQGERRRPVPRRYPWRLTWAVTRRDTLPIAVGRS
jgi:hypothetical protein